VKWISPTRFVVSEESQWQVKERDPSATLGQYGEVEKSEHESEDRQISISFGLMLKVNASFYPAIRLAF
jgi:hypothetical protein